MDETIAENKDNGNENENEKQECAFATDQQYLVAAEGVDVDADVYGRLVRPEELAAVPYTSTTAFFVAGDIGELYAAHGPALDVRRWFIVADWSSNFADLAEEKSVGVVTAAELSRSVHGVGVFVRRMFGAEDDNDWFDRVASAHSFQELTESNKTSKAHRTGLYLSPVVLEKQEKEGKEKDGKEEDGKEEGGDDDKDAAAVRFNLLRCSSNFSGPTEAFQQVDAHLVARLNDLAQRHFDAPAPMNHVLAQIYHNHTVRDARGQVVGEKKARIKDHSDKTKDMAPDGVIAFVSFYDAAASCKGGAPEEKTMTRLRFRLKKDVALGQQQTQFDVVLWPGSCLLIPLSTNRLYTHEIVPPAVNADKIPTRMGYVVRCSNVEAVHRGGQTFLADTGVALAEPTQEQTAMLKDCYYRENCFSARMVYPPIDFSLNAGDFMRPIVLAAPGTTP